MEDKQPVTDALTRRNDPDTSYDAAASSQKNLPRLVGLVLAELHRAGHTGATSEELASSLGIDRVSVSPRLRPLATRKFIADSGIRRVGKSGKAAIVWVHSAFLKEKQQ